jgi:hypothetical protein
MGLIDFIWDGDITYKTSVIAAIAVTLIVVFTILTLCSD